MEKKKFRNNNVIVPDCCKGLIASQSPTKEHPIQCGEGFICPRGNILASICGLSPLGYGREERVSEAGKTG